MTPRAKKIWEDRYKYAGDQTFTDSLMRVYNRIQHEIPEENKQFAHDALKNHHFVPGGRILASFGTTGYNEMGLNCFTLKVEDNLESIGEMQKRSRIIFSFGGGVGFRFNIRPKGFPVNRPYGSAAGVCNYIDEYNLSVYGATQRGLRRGAALGVIDITHPEVFDYATAKRSDNDRWQCFNVSVGINEAFVDALQRKAKVSLSYNGMVSQTMDAKTLLYQLAENAWHNGDPGLFHEVNCNRWSNLNDPIVAFNPCGEVPLPNYGVCCLGSIVLPAIASSDDGIEYTPNFNALEQTIRGAVNILDAVLDITAYPYSEIEIKARSQRRIGIGVTGFGTYLTMLGLIYGSNLAINHTELLFRFIRDVAYDESVKLASIKGKAPSLENESMFNYFRNSLFVQRLDHSTRLSIAKHGCRNTALLSVAPTGTITEVISGDYEGLLSTGIEPVFQSVYQRRYTSFDDTERIETQDYLIAKQKGRKCVTAHDVTPDGHMDMLETAQRYVDNSISKTINMPHEATVDDVYAVYERCVLSDFLKGITIFRDRCDKAGVLTRLDEETRCDDTTCTVCGV